MTLRIVAASAACIGVLTLATFALADGMPDEEDENFNPVPSVPGTPAPGVTQPPPIKQTKPAPAPTAPAPAAPAATEPAPAPAPAEPKEPSPPPEEPAPTPAPAPAAPPTPAPAPSAATTPAVQKKPVYEVLSVDVKVGAGQSAAVTVKGTARTGGWKDIELKPLPTFAPEVGMRSYTLVGTSPTGPATQALTPVTATITIDPLPADVKTIRVLGETNEVAQTFR